MNAASSTVSDVLIGLTKGRDEQRRTQHACSAVGQEALLMRLQWLQRLPHPSAGIRHCGHGRLPSFRQPRRVWWRRMKGSGPVRAHLEMPAHGEHEEANQPREEPGMSARAERSGEGGVGSRTRLT